MKETKELKDIIEGMELAENVVNTFGQTLLAAGTVLSRRHINLLKTWSITKVIITAGDTGEEENTMSEELRRAAENELKRYMHWIPNNEYEKAIYNMALIATANRISAK